MRSDRIAGFATLRLSERDSPAAALTALRAALPLRCAELLPLPKVQSHLTNPVSVKVDETHPPATLGDLAVLQVGAPSACGVART